MALSDFWEEFVTEYSADDIYWYFPKGGTSDTEEFRQKFEIFAKFEGHIWNVDLQAKFLAAIQAAGLSKGETNALSRIMKRVYENLGLCWVLSGLPVRITNSGRQYLAEKGPSKVLDSHVWRYQLPNKLNDVDATKGVSLFPHIVVVDMLLACDNYITNDEFVLFAVRMKRASQTAKAIERVKAWRAAKASTRTEILDRVKLTKWKTISQNSSFPLAFHRCDLLLDRRTDQLSVSGKNIEDLQAMLDLYKGETVQIEFKDAPDTVAFYSEPDRIPTKLEALDYYMDVSDVEKAVTLYKILPPDLRGPKTVEEFERAQFLEKHLEEFLENRLHLVEPGLKKIGRQHKTAVGPIDLYARAQNGDLVVIELKKDRAADKVFGQICRYIGCIKEDHAVAGENVRGYIVGREIDQKLTYATKAVPFGLVTLQVFDFKSEKGKEDWIRIKAA